MRSCRRGFESGCVILSAPFRALAPHTRVRIAQHIAHIFCIGLDKDVARRLLAQYFDPRQATLVQRETRLSDMRRTASGALICCAANRLPARTCQPDRCRTGRTTADRYAWPNPGGRRSPAFPFQPCWRSLNRCSLPVSVRGSVAMNSILRGYLYGAMLAFTKSCSARTICSLAV